MAISLVQTKQSYDATSDTSITVVLDSPVTTGNLLVVSVGWSAASTESAAVSDDNGNTWTKSNTNAVFDGNAAALYGIQTFFVKNAVGGGSAVTATFLDVRANREIVVSEYSGAITTSGSDVSHSGGAVAATTSTDAVTSGAATTTANGDLIYGVVGDSSGGSATVSAGTGFTARVNGTRLHAEDMIQAAAGSVAATWTFNATDRYVAGMVAFKRALSPPVNTVAPVASGTATVGQTLSTTNGTWSGSPSSFAYQWQRDGLGDGVFTNISGATNSSYTIAGRDTSSKIRCSVTASNSDGPSSPGYSNQLGVVASGQALQSEPTTIKPLPGIARQIAANSLKFGSNYDWYSTQIVSDAFNMEGASFAGRDLMYVSWEADTLFSIVPYSVSAANGWLATISGSPVQAQSFPTTYLTQIGLLAYQREFVSRVDTFLKTYGNAGVFIDNILGDLHGYAVGGAYPDQYPDQPSWQAAMQSFVAYVGPALRSLGYYVLGNTYIFVPGNPGTDNGDQMHSWLGGLAPYLSGCMAEYWLLNRANLTQFLNVGGTNFLRYWKNWVTLIDTVQSAGCHFYPLVRADTASTSAMLWGRANFLLGWNGVDGAYFFKRTSSSVDPWDATWTRYIGVPSGDRVASGVGFQRSFTQGVVLVNPHVSSSQSFTLPAGNFTDPTGATVSGSVTLAAGSASILVSQPAPAQPPTSGVTQVSLEGSPYNWSFFKFGTTGFGARRRQEGTFIEQVLPAYGELADLITEYEAFLVSRGIPVSPEWGQIAAGTRRRLLSL